MCNPLFAVGAAMMVGSMVAKQQAAKQVEKARNSAIEAETIRQRGYDQEADALNAVSQDRYTDFAGKQTDKAKSLGDYFEGQAKPVAESGGATEPVMPTSASNIVVAEEGKQLGKAREYGSQQDTALGNLRAFGDLLGGISRGQANDAAQLGIIGGFKRGSQGVLPLELEAANGKGAGARLFGDLLGMGGSMAMMGGMGGGGPSWGGLFGSTPAAGAGAGTTGFGAGAAPNFGYQPPTML